MFTSKMHVDEVDTNVPLVVQLLTSQFPQWANLPIEPAHSAGTGNALYRLGDDMVVRLPRIPSAVGQVDKEQKWLPRLAPRSYRSTSRFHLRKGNRATATRGTGRSIGGSKVKTLPPAASMIHAKQQPIWLNLSPRYSRLKLAMVLLRANTTFSAAYR